MTIYHYTDSNALISILENKKLWLNDVLFMNDKNELFDAFLLLAELGNEEENKDYSVLFNIINQMRHDPQMIGNFFFDGYMITSFCKEADLLEMWRGYGNGGQKYCLGFDEEVLIELAEQQYPGTKFVLSECVYDKEEKKKVLKKFLESRPLGIKTELVNDGKEYRQTLDTKWFTDFVLLSLSFKNSGFISEKEVRLIGYIIDRDKKKHRVNKFGITPYYELDLTKEVIRSFWIGPSLDLPMAKYSLDSLINQSNHLSPRIIDPEGRMHFSQTSFRE